MTDAQKQIVKQQLARVQEAERAIERERGRMMELLIMVEPRMADPDSGLTFDIETLAFVERPADT